MVRHLKIGPLVQKIGGHTWLSHFVCGWASLCGGEGGTSSHSGWDAALLCRLLSGLLHPMNLRLQAGFFYVQSDEAYLPLQVGGGDCQSWLLGVFIIYRIYFLAATGLRLRCVPILHHLLSGLLVLGPG